MLLISVPGLLQAANRMYFVPIVEHDDGGQARVILEWGPLEGGIPSEIVQFKLYRSVDGGDFSAFESIDYQVAPPETIRAYVLADVDETRKNELFSILQEISDSLTPGGPTITDSNFGAFIYDIIEPSSGGFNPLQRMLLIRFHSAVARAVGLCAVDERVAVATSVQYLLTAVSLNGQESLPIGKTQAINPKNPTILPAPAGLSQVHVGGCSTLHKNLDDLKIHMTWEVPFQPKDISLNILTYGYDLFWSSSDLGTINLRNGIPEKLFKVNSKPIIVSGRAPDPGKDAFLAQDSGQTHDIGPAWERGQVFYYYLAARDLSGHYSAVSSVLEATVVDAMPPVPAFRLHTEMVQTTTDGSSDAPKLALVWDQVNPVNYIRYYGVNRGICSADDTEVCMAPSANACQKGLGVHCVDLDVQRYHVFRFESPAGAAAWGTDSDGDLWPDEQENTAGTDPCDKDDMPGGILPPQWAATISQNDAAFQRSLADKHVQMVFVDEAVAPENYDKVYYYKVLAEDDNGNFSPLSPPIRGVLHNRTQPDVQAGLQVLDCDNFEALHDDTTEYKENDDILTLVDNTGKAESFRLVRNCNPGTHMIFDEIIVRGLMESGAAHITAEDLPDNSCENPGCPGGSIEGYTVVFFDDRGLPMATSDLFNMQDLCPPISLYYGAVILNASCLWVESGPGKTADGPVKVCAELAPGETARVYAMVGGNMSPVASIPPAEDQENGGTVCAELTDMGGPVVADLCLGVRVFSENHVGSPMSYLDCLEVVDRDGPKPPALLIEGLYSKETTDGQPYFDLRWSAPADGQAAFVIAMERDGGAINKTVFPDAQNDAGQFSQDISLNRDTDLDQEWCVKMRSIDTAMRMSEWSGRTCATWRPAQLDNLPWPHMEEPVETGDIQAFFIKESGSTIYGCPAILLSGDLAHILEALPCSNSTDGSCLTRVPVCTGSRPCIFRNEIDGELKEAYVDFGVSLANLDMAGYITPLVRAQQFILYRQEEGRDFVQVSPLVEDFTLFYDAVWVEPGTQAGYFTYHYLLNDPFYFLRYLAEDVIDGVDAATGQALDKDQFTGARIFYLDRYPFTSGSTVRYKMVMMNPETGEPETVRTSNWITLP